MKYTKDTVLKNNRKCLIRDAFGDDAQEVLNVFLVTHEQTDYLSSYKDETTFDVEFEKKYLSDIENSDEELYLVAVVDGHIVGTASVFSIGSNKVRHRAEFGIAIEKDYWGIGIGQALTAACIEFSKSAGYSQLELEVVGDNTSAISLYKKMGFVEFGRNPRGFISRFQGWQELVYMRLELN